MGLSVLLKNPQWHNVECAGVRGCQRNFGGAAFVMGLQEAGGAKAPTVACLKARKPEFGARCGEIIADVFREGEELVCHDGTDGMGACMQS